MLIDLGGGTSPHRRADVVIDLHHPKGTHAQDATAIPWLLQAGQTFPPGVVDEVYASHFMEHVPHGQPLIDVMNEAWRVLKPGGSFTMIMPVVGYTNITTGQPESNHIGWQPWADPTHVSYWWFPEALMYFCEGPFKPLADYGMRVWNPLGPFVGDHRASIYLKFQEQEAVALGSESWWAVRDGWEGVARLTKPM